MVKVDPEFKRHLLSLNPIELAFLEESILSEGCREPLVVWKEQGVLIDGHHRYDICKRHNKPFSTTEMSFADREDVLDWMDKNQVARRNCDPKDMEIIRGRIYNRRKKAEGRPSQSKERGQSGPVNTGRTAAVVAAELDTSPRTIRRSGKRADVYDAMLEIGDEEAAAIARSVTRDQIEEVHDKPANEAAEELKRFSKGEKKPPVRKRVEPMEPEQNEGESPPKSRGVGIERAHEAIACLKRIPKKDELRVRAFQIVSDWIKHNKG